MRLIDHRLIWGWVGRGGMSCFEQNSAFVDVELATGGITKE